MKLTRRSFIQYSAATACLLAAVFDHRLAPGLGGDDSAPSQRQQRT